jgi:hypothetical protein
VSLLDWWSVTRVTHGSELFLTASAPAAGIGLRVGDSVPFSQTMCRQMISGAGPRVAPDVRAVQAFKAWVAFADAAGIKIEAFVGMPIMLPDGGLFGTLCGFGSQVQSDSLSDPPGGLVGVGVLVQGHVQVISGSLVTVGR